VKTAEELRDRTRKFAVDVVKLFRSLPRSTDAQVLGKQVLRSGTSVAANYRAACRGRSRAEFVAKLGIVAEEADETVFWLELIADCAIVSRGAMQNLILESKELCAISSASQKTAHSRLN
jgi:four helix bundle protein